LGSLLSGEPASPSPSAAPPACALSLSNKVLKKKKVMLGSVEQLVLHLDCFDCALNLGRPDFIYSVGVLGD